jgi:hypothetical protein
MRAQHLTLSPCQLRLGLIREVDIRSMTSLVAPVRDTGLQDLVNRVQQFLAGECFSRKPEAPREAARVARSASSHREHDDLGVICSALIRAARRAAAGIVSP